MAPKGKKASKRSVEKYCTPLVGEVFDSVSQNALKKVKKHSNATGKWVGKMKLSIQRKVQVASRVIFLTDGTLGLSYLNSALAFFPSLN